LIGSLLSVYLAGNTVFAAEESGGENDETVSTSDNNNKKKNEKGDSGSGDNDSGSGDKKKDGVVIENGEKDDPITTGQKKDKYSDKGDGDSDKPTQEVEQTTENIDPKVTPKLYDSEVSEESEEVEDTTLAEEKVIGLDKDIEDNCISEERKQKRTSGTPDDQKDYKKKGTIKVKKVDSILGKLIPGTILKITPDPYTLKGSFTIQDNLPSGSGATAETIDCDPSGGVTEINNIELSNYKIQEINSSNGLILHEFDIAMHDQLANMSLNIVNRDLGIPLDGDHNKVPNQFIIILNDDVLDPQSLADQIASKGVKVIHVYDKAAKGIAIKVSNQKILDEILLDPRIASAEQDQIGRIATAAAANATQLNQTLPPGINRVRTVVDTSTTLSEGDNAPDHRDVAAVLDTDVDIAIIDTGVSLTHPDLNVYRNVTFVENTTLGDDDQGHGSHVAGVAAAKDNSLGVVGMAPGARLWAVKVCDKFGSCTISDQIEAVEYVTEHADEIDVVNFSIENSHSTALNNAIAESVAAGVTYIVAAGNSATDASSTTSPADAPDVITVSAVGDSDGKCGGIGKATYIGEDDTFASFSNFGSVVDIAAPGVDIFSTYNGSEYGLDSGTSMAAPHVTGAVASYKAANPDASPEETRSWLINSGSVQTTTCDGKAHGYFSADPDGLAEPMLYAKID
jgi:hypothetical protein